MPATRRSTFSQWIIQPERNEYMRILAGTENGLYKLNWIHGERSCRSTGVEFEGHHICALEAHGSEVHAAVRGVGLMRSEDGGETWESLLSSLAGQQIVSIAVSPRDSQRLWVGTQPAALQLLTGLNTCLLRSLAPGSPSSQLMEQPLYMLRSFWPVFKRAMKCFRLHSHLSQGRMRFPIAGHCRISLTVTQMTWVLMLKNLTTTLANVQKSRMVNATIGLLAEQSVLLS